MLVRQMAPKLIRVAQDMQKLVKMLKIIRAVSQKRLESHYLSLRVLMQLPNKMLNLLNKDNQMILN